VLWFRSTAANRSTSKTKRTLTLWCQCERVTNSGSSILSFAMRLVLVFPSAGKRFFIRQRRPTAGSLRSIVGKRDLRTWSSIFLGLLVALGACWAALDAQENGRSVWDGVYTEKQANNGHVDYDRQCARCHGDMLEGDDEIPPLAGSNFVANWNGLTVGDLFERIRTTMPFNNPESLSGEAKARILAYILSSNGFPSGDRDLSSRTEVLKQIRIEAQQLKK
jgi:S-disulfanyl-L-cysteine oxidoreductase SoxD